MAVGGASAGGLEPFEQLFAHFPANGNLASIGQGSGRHPPSIPFDRTDDTEPSLQPHVGGGP